MKQLVQKRLALYKTDRFITLFIAAASQWALSWVRKIQPTTWHPHPFLTPILILSTHLSLLVQEVFFEVTLCEHSNTSLHTTHTPNLI